MLWFDCYSFQNRVSDWAPFILKIISALFQITTNLFHNARQCWARENAGKRRKVEHRNVQFSVFRHLSSSGQSTSAPRLWSMEALNSITPSRRFCKNLLPSNFVLHPPFEARPTSLLRFFLHFPHPDEKPFKQNSILLFLTCHLPFPDECSEKYYITSAWCNWFRSALSLFSLRPYDHFSLYLEPFLSRLFPSNLYLFFGVLWSAGKRSRRLRLPPDPPSLAFFPLFFTGNFLLLSVVVRLISVGSRQRANNRRACNSFGRGTRLLLLRSAWNCFYWCPEVAFYLLRFSSEIQVVESFVSCSSYTLCFSFSMQLCTLQDW